jgi:hypothetical protein
MICGDTQHSITPVAHRAKYLSIAGCCGDDEQAISGDTSARLHAAVRVSTRLAHLENDAAGITGKSSKPTTAMPRKSRRIASIWKRGNDSRRGRRQMFLSSSKG